MYTGLRKFFLNRSNKQNIRVRKPINMEHVKNAAIILDSEESISTVEAFMKELKSKNVKFKVYFLVYNKGQFEHYQESSWFNVLLAKSSYRLNYSKFPDVEELISNEFDILIDFTSKSSYYKDLLLSHSKSRFIVGRKTSSMKVFQPAYDLLISLNDEENTIKNYIKQIQIFLSQIKI